MFEFLSAKDVLVLGGTGRVGSILSRELKTAPAHRLVITGRSASAPPEFPPGIEYMCLELPAGISKLETGFDFIVNLAGVSDPRRANEVPGEALTLNLQLVHGLLEHYASTTAHLLVVSSVRSSGVASMYSVTKVAAEALACSFTTGCKATVLRLGNVMETAKAISGILKSLDAATSSSGLVTSGTDYFHPTAFIPACFHLAMRVDTEPGSIFTPVLPAIPIPFLAGVIAGSRASEVSPTWSPMYQLRPAEPALLPEWWYPFSRILEVSEADWSGPLYVVDTNFGRRADEDEGNRIKTKIAQQESVPFGEFIQWLRNEGFLEGQDSKG